MVTNDPYMNLEVARRLQRLGEWDLALAVLDGSEGTVALELRADIAFDRFFWRLDAVEDATDAMSALDDGSVLSALLTARLAYTRLSFFEPLADDRDTAEAGYRIVAADPAMTGWGEFHWGVLADNIDDNRAAATEHYRKAMDVSRGEGDLVLESYVVRHLAGHAFELGERIEGLRMLRRSLHLRSSSGMRPQTAASQLALARELPVEDSERATLIEASRAAADELGLAWVQQGLAELKP